MVLHSLDATLDILLVVFLERSNLRCEFDCVLIEDLVVIAHALKMVVAEQTFAHGGAPTLFSKFAGSVHLIFMKSYRLRLKK